MLSQLVQFNKSYQIWNINEGQFVPRCGTEILLLINYYKNDQIWLDISKPVFEYESHLRELENIPVTLRWPRMGPFSHAFQRFVYQNWN